MVHSRKYQNILIVSFYIVLLSLLVGCFPNEKRSNKELVTKNYSKEIPNAIQEQIGENLIINAQVEKGKSRQYDILEVDLREFQFEIVWNSLIKDEAIKSTEVIENENYLSSTDSLIHGADGSILWVGLGGFSFRNKKEIYKPYGTILSSYNIYQKGNIETIFDKDSLEGLNKNEVIKKIEMLLENLSVTNLIRKRVIALDYETLVNEYEKLNIDLQKNKKMEAFVPKDEAYLIIYECGFDDISIISKGYYIPDDNGNIISCLGSRIEAIVTKEDIISLDVSNLYDIKSVEKKNNMINFNQIVMNLEKKYSDLILDKPLEIKEIKLGYVPKQTNSKINSRKLYPYWIFTVSQKTTYTDEKGRVEIEESFPLYFSYYDGNELEVEEFE